MKSKGAVLQMQRALNEYRGEPLTAVMPGVALGQMWRLVGVADTALLVVAGCVVLAGFAGMIAVLLTGLEERRREMAVLRSVGARPAHIFWLLLLESCFLAAAGVVLGFLVAALSLAAGAPLLARRFGLFVDVGAPGAYDLAIAAAVVGAGAVAGLLPAWRARRGDPAIRGSAAQRRGRSVPVGAPPPVAPAHSALRSAYLPSDDEIVNALANVLGPDTPSSGLSVPLISPSTHDRAEALAATIEAQALAVLDLTWPRAEHDALSVDSPEEPALVFERPRRAAHGAVVATGASPDPDFIVARPENDAADEFAISFEPVAAAPVPPPFESGGGSAADDAITGPDLPESLGHALDQIELPRTSRTLEDAAGYESMALPRVLTGEGTAVPFEFDMVPAQSEQKEWAPRSEEERHTDHALEEDASTGSSGADLPSIPPSLLDAFPTSPTDVGIAMEPEWKRLFPAAADGRPARAGVASAVGEPPPARFDPAGLRIGHFPFRKAFESFDAVRLHAAVDEPRPHAATAADEHPKIALSVEAQARIVVRVIHATLVVDRSWAGARRAAGDRSTMPSPAGTAGPASPRRTRKTSF